MLQHNETIKTSRSFIMLQSGKMIMERINTPAEGELRWEISLPGRSFKTLTTTTTTTRVIPQGPTSPSDCSTYKVIQEVKILLYNLCLTTSPLPAMVLIIAWRNSSISSPPPPSSSASCKSVMLSMLKQVLIPFIFLIWYCFLSWATIRGIHILTMQTKQAQERTDKPRISSAAFPNFRYSSGLLVWPWSV